ncbi:MULTISPECIES: hypothetical protein [Leptolyngbya]|jgi:chromosome segregation ATPase|uniref:Uncharacterized protein n=2 Tax=Leptolyngbya boryana TaxID=1184 RepID=A0A1Z4JK62_LEPBY|nr:MULTISPECIES: hypothetical protein [Leptolyngbya]BAY57126.1 hypothetical protein NIES2135_39900 [Leptolyngbya boryana NIES-2135]MBD2367123.1 hypothetical protein [Leptolyngbya sp. FACHB-161]MBD2373524.1 hypothetical protein [Leptolyngbya sp. FACHB-238]MBD2397932.1 hypothetical protein [Leptolyngbya sp. FACHB-239]MBD2404434.1 hypothetical protein [Leptolyngbya sp. FACHB-402]
MATQRRSQKNITSNHKTLTIEAETVQPENQDSEKTEVHELKAALEQAQQTEKSLQESITQLKAQVEDHDAIVKQLEQTQQTEKSLQESITQLKAQVEDHDAIVKHLQANVEEAQHTALKLAESNQTLIEENKQLRTSAGKIDHLQSELEKAQQAALKLAESNQALIAENKTLQENQATEQKSALATAQAEADLRSHQDILKKRQAVTLAHPVFPNNFAPVKSSDPDVGWFD